MRKQLLSRFLFALVSFALCFSAVLSIATVAAQQPSEKITIGGESFTAGMAQQEAMKKLERCCSVTGGRDPRDTKAKSFFIWDRGRTEILGEIWFRNAEVERVQRDGAFSEDPEVVSFALSLYRELSQRAHSGVATVILQMGTSEATNASSKVITFTFGDGQSIQMEIVAPDDSQKLRNQVGLKESLEKR